MYTASDDATIAFSTDAHIDLVLDSSNNPYTLGGEIVVGEQVSYTASIMIPEDGALTNSTGVIYLPPHVSYVSVDDIFGPSSLGTTQPGGL